MNKEIKEQKILSTAREQFSQAGYYGARMDAIASESKINKRIVYEFCKTKERLYLIVLSDVSIEVQNAFDHWFSKLPQNTDPVAIYNSLIHILESNPYFVRLWAWERLSVTIHGMRILETVNTCFAKLRSFITQKSPTISDQQFEAIEALCHGYMLTAAMYLKCDPDIDEAETPTAAKPESSPACQKLDMSMTCQAVLMESIKTILLANNA